MIEVGFGLVIATFFNRACGAARVIRVDWIITIRLHTHYGCTNDISTFAETGGTGICIPILTFFIMVFSLVVTPLLASHFCASYMAEFIRTLTTETAVAFDVETFTKAIKFIFNLTA
jgi:hypothetical protein